MPDGLRRRVASFKPQSRKPVRRGCDGTLASPVSTVCQQAPEELSTHQPMVTLLLTLQSFPVVFGMLTGPRSLDIFRSPAQGILQEETLLDCIAFAEVRSCHWLPIWKALAGKVVGHLGHGGCSSSLLHLAGLAAALWLDLVTAIIPRAASPLTFTGRLTLASPQTAEGLHRQSIKSKRRCTAV